MTTGLLAIPSVRGKKDAIVSKFCGLSCGELINEAAFQADVRFMMFNSMLNGLTSKISSEEIFSPDFNS